MADTYGQVHQHVAELSRSLHNPQLAAEVVAQRIVDCAAGEIPGAQYAGIKLAASRRVQISAVSDPVSSVLDAIQEYHQQGPCRAAPACQSTVRVDDLDQEIRWPLFCRLPETVQREVPGRAGRRFAARAPIRPILMLQFRLVGS